MDVAKPRSGKKVRTDQTPVSSRSPDPIPVRMHGGCSKIFGKNLNFTNEPIKQILAIKYIYKLRFPIENKYNTFPKFHYCIHTLKPCIAQLHMLIH